MSNPADFARSLKLLLIDEGGLCDDPHDHGGRTAHGITQRRYDAFRRRKGRPVQDVWKVPAEEVVEFYHEEYWQPHCDELPAGVDYCFFDDAVNAGPVQATRTLQRVLHVQVDGHMGPVTRDAISYADPEKLIKGYCDARRAFYRGLAQFPRYGRGWLARVNHVEHGAEEIYATGTSERPALPDKLRPLARAKANPADTKQPSILPENAGVVAGMTATAGGVITHIPSAITEYVHYSLLAVAVVSVAFVVLGILHKRRVRRAIA